MKVLLIHQAFASPSDPGGTRHFELARYLVRRGHDFTIVASDLNYLTGTTSTQAGGGQLVPRGRQPLITRETCEGVNVLRTYTHRSLHRSFFWRVVSFLSFMVNSVWASKQVGKVDLVMGTSPPIFQAVSSCVVAALRRRPFLLEVRDLWPEFAIDMGILANPLFIRLSRRLERFLYRRATHIVVNSPAYRDYLIKKRGVSRHKISLIANGVDPNMFNPDATGERVRREWNLTDKFVVTYAGALGAANDIPTILNAAQLLQDEPRIHFLLVGDGKDRTHLEERMRALSLPNITFTGSRPKSEMGDILAASDACVATLKNIPMFATTYPNKIFDYMAAGRPTVLAIDGVIREVVEKANGGIFVPPGDADRLAKAVRALENDRTRARQMGQDARKYVTEHFNRHQQAEQFLNVLQRLASVKAS